MTRIALVTHGLAGGGGVPTIVRWLRDGLEAQGWTADVHDLATSRADDASRRLASPSTWSRRSLCHLRELPVRHRHWGADAVEVEALRYRPRRELTAALRGYDLVQVVAGSPAWAAVATGCGRPVVLQVATLAAWERAFAGPGSSAALRLWRRQMTRLTSRIETAALRAVDGVLVENDAMLARVHAAGQHRVVKSPPGVDTAVFVPAPGGWQRAGPLLTVCRLADPRKGLELMVRAYARLVARDPGVPPLILAGFGALAPPVAELVVRLALTERVRIRTDLTPDGLVRLYQQASVFLQTSYEEGLGLAALEAMACGLPVVATATDGARETVDDGVTGWLVEHRTAGLPAVLAERMAHALAGAGGPAGRRGRDRCVAEFSSAACLRRFLAVYDAVRPRLPAGMP